MEFRTVLKNSNIYLFDGENAFPNATEKESTLNAYVDSVIINWSVEFEYREWGIKSIIIYIKDFEFEVKAEDDEEEEKLCCASHVWNSKDFTVLDEGIRNEDIYSITSMEINFKDKTITLNS